MLHCGAARRVINPEKGHHLAGYGSNYLNEGVHDDLVVSVIFLNDGKSAAVLINFDLIGMGGNLNKAVRESVASTLGLRDDQVFITCTHTHGGPEVRDYHHTSGACPNSREDYNARLVQWSREAAADAKQNAEPCELFYNFTQVAENMNRRYSFPNRKFLYTPDHKQLAGLSSEYVDRELGVVAFKKKGTSNRYKALITNYTMHPVCVGNSSLLCTADYPGAIRRTVEETFAGCICLPTTGATGDLHPLQPEAGFAYAQRVGTTIGQTVLGRTYDAIRAEDTSLRLAWNKISLPARDAATSKLYPQGDEQAYSPDWAARGNKTVETHFSLLGIGPLLFVGVPGELVAELGAFVKWNSPFLKTYILFQATDNVGYIPAGNQYLWGGYEAVYNPFARRAGELLVRSILDAADGLTLERPLVLPSVK
ncbi:MAG TPA: neutral/alkaline non-lysosomal ceramidase N-terminal domain-containing protein [Planctomycetota bacterium]|nr:neutral/alkaline non-lysosomal ceramidase N-terminal domain-containing protein [Planctomycetota bacterium]